MLIGRWQLMAVMGGLALWSAPSATAAIPLTPDGQLGSPRAKTGTIADVSDVQLAGGGRYVVFDSTATDLMPSQPTPPAGTTCAREVFRRDLLTNTTIVVSRLPGGGVLGNGCSSHPSVSYDGTVVAFLTQAKNLGSDGTHAVAVVRNLANDTLTTASVADGQSGAPASDGVGAVALSGDGTKVAFTSANALHSGVSTGGVPQLWLRDLVGNTTTLVSAGNGSATSPASAAAGSPSVDEFGQHVAFTTAATLTAKATAGTGQVYVRTLASNTTTLASVASGGALANAASDSPSLSAIGNAVAFRSTATNLGDPSGQADDYVRLLTSNSTRLASTAANGTTIANAPSGPPSVSAHGNIVAFSSAATNLGAVANGHAQIWVHDYLRGLVTLASPAAAGGGGANGDSTAPSMSEGGIAVAFQTVASNLDSAKATATVDAYVRRVRVAVAPSVSTTAFLARDGLDGRTLDEQSPPPSDGPGVEDVALSANGRYAAFLIPGQSDLTGDPEVWNDGAVYLRDLETGETETVSRQSDTTTAVGAPMLAGQTLGTGTDFVGISGDGTEVAFESADHVYVRNLTTGVTTQGDVTSGATPVSANGPSFDANLSSDGRYLVFTSQASNLTPNHPAVGDLPYDDVYERDLQTGTTTIVSLPDGVAPGPANTTFAPNGISGFDNHTSVADGGRYVVFSSRDAQLGQNPPNQTGESLVAYLRDMQTDHTVTLQGPLTPESSYYNHDQAEISADGSTVAFDSIDSLVPGEPANPGEQVFYRAVQFNGAGAFDSQIHIASVPDGPEPGPGDTFGTPEAVANDPSLSTTGRLITFDSSATNYGTTTPGTTEVWQRDTLIGHTVLVSRATGASSAAANGPTVTPPASSADGTEIVFESAAPNLAPDGANHDFADLRTLPPALQPPVHGSVTISPLPPAAGTLETCNPGTWTNGPTFSYTWLIDGTKLVSTSATYTPVAGDFGHQLTCKVLGKNAAGQDTATSSSATVIRYDKLTVTVAGSGVVTGDVSPVIGCSTTCSQSYPDGTVVTLTAAPSPGYQFSAWSAGGCPATAATCSVTLSGDTAVTATFTAVAHPAGTHVLTVTLVGDGSGKVTGDVSPAIACAPTCVQTYPSGAIVTLTAAPAGGSTFGGWSGGPCAGSAAGTCTVTLSADQAISATFTLVPLQNIVPPSITGVKQPESTLTCNPGTWNQPVRYAYRWYQQAEASPLHRMTIKLRGKAFGKPGARGFLKRARVISVPNFVQVGSAQTLAVPYLDQSATYYCAVTATSGRPQSVDARSAQVTINPSAPALARSTHFPFRVDAPHISARIGVNGVNTCEPGVWNGGPVFTYRWYAVRRAFLARVRPIGPVSNEQLGTGQQLTITGDDEGRTLECAVTGKSKWGSTTEDSNTYVVPVSAPRVQDGPEVTVTTQQPAGQQVLGAAGGYGVAEQIHLDCGDGQWNRSDLRFSHQWTIDYPTGTPENGASLDFDMRPGKLQYDDVTVHCIVTATSHNNISSTAESGPITISNGCDEWYADTIDAGTVDASIGGPTQWLYATTADNLFSEDESGGNEVYGPFGLVGGDLDINGPGGSTLAASRAETDGPNCEDYQKYLAGQGYDVKQGPNPDNDMFWIEHGFPDYF